MTTYAANIQREAIRSAHHWTTRKATRRHHNKLCRYWAISTGDRALARIWKKDDEQ